MPRAKKATRATSRECVRRIALNYAAATRHHTFNRVSDEFLAAVESNAINFIKNRVNKHPSTGKTLK